MGGSAAYDRGIRGSAAIATSRVDPGAAAQAEPEGAP